VILNQIFELTITKHECIVFRGLLRRLKDYSQL